MRRVTPWLLLSLVPGAVIAACAGGSNNPSPATTTATSTTGTTPDVALAASGAPRLAAAATAAPVFACPNVGLGGPSVTFGPTVPPDLRTFSNQPSADCFAWSELVALNWPTGTGTFGAPMDTTPVAWETYMTSDLVFTPDGSKPPAWGTEPSIPSGCPPQAPSPGAGRPRPMRPFKHIGKASTEAARASKAAASRFKLTAPKAATAGTVTPFGPGDIALATSPPNWLGAQNGTNVWFEIRVNEDEYNTVVADGLYNANLQTTYVNNGNPVVMPKGCSTAAGQNCPNNTSVTGAIELKAAWMEAPDANDPAQKDKWSRYKLTDGVVVDPNTGKCRATTLALVGLHVLHKTTTQPTWVWATFEHVDNAPVTGSKSPPPKYGYNFNNPSCTSKQMSVPASCVPGGGTSGNVSVTVSCTPNTKPPYNLDQNCPGPVPIQVERTVALDNDAQNINSQIQAFIGQNYPGSVWQYYQLINVIWSSNPLQDPTKPVNAPEVPTGMTSGGGAKVFSTVLETYMQTMTCTDCHQYATIAQGNTFSDFSFAVGTAGPSSTQSASPTAAPAAPSPKK